MALEHPLIAVRDRIEKLKAAAAAIVTTAEAETAGVLTSKQAAQFSSIEAQVAEASETRKALEDELIAGTGSAGATSKVPDRNNAAASTATQPSAAPISDRQRAINEGWASVAKSVNAELTSSASSRSNAAANAFPKAKATEVYGKRASDRQRRQGDYGKAASWDEIAAEVNREMMPGA